MASFRSAIAFISLACLGLGWLGETCAGQTAAPRDEPGRVWLRRARAALAAHRTVRAKIYQRIHLYDQELVASGELIQGPPEKNLLFLDLKLKVAAQDYYYQQRSDGQFYWQQKFEDGIPVLTRVDLSRVEAARKARAGAAAGANAGEPVPPLLGLGGMAYLLDQLDAWCVFPEVYERRLPGKQALPVIVLEGGWRPERLAKWLPEGQSASQDKSLDLSKLPTMLPDTVMLVLGHDDLFPRRIEYGFSEGRRLDQRRREPLVQIHFESPQFDVTVDPRSFTFAGGVVAPLDDTDGYLLRAGLSPAPAK